jgi:predicted dehydrogenase
MGGSHLLRGEKKRRYPRQTTLPTFALHKTVKQLGVVMVRIGILGSDNSHADRFSEILNRSDHAAYLPDSGAKVVAIWGQEPERTQQVAANGRIDMVVDDPAALIGQVDAIFCVTRHGGLHRELVIPYLEAGIPVFIDKPLAVSPEDARAIVHVARATRVPFTSFSTVRFSKATQEFAAEAAKLGGVRVGSYSGPATRRNTYGGIIFYAVHSIEMMLMIQGTGVVWVDAQEGPAVDDNGNGNISVTCGYAGGALGTLALTVDAKYAFTAHAIGREGLAYRTLDISDCYHEGMKVILPALRGEQDAGVTPEAMIEMVQIATAIERSLDENRRVELSEL